MRHGDVPGLFTAFLLHCPSRGSRGSCSCWGETLKWSESRLSGEGTQSLADLKDTSTYINYIELYSTIDYWWKDKVPACFKKGITNIDIASLLSSTTSTIPPNRWAWTDSDGSGAARWSDTHRAFQGCCFQRCSGDTGLALASFGHDVPLKWGSSL